jgi:exosortase A-associated hydrolase 1
MGRDVAFSERAITFRCRGEQLHGILATPALAAERGVVIVVGGPQYRAGSHRQFVHLARALAAAGIPVLRFDVRGMGDSSGDLRTFEDIADDIAAAIDAFLANEVHLKTVVLLGLCDGASAALLYVDERPGDRRVSGLVLINPWVRSVQTLAQVHIKHYYWGRFIQPAFWLKLLRGGVTWRSIPEFLRNLRLTLRSQRPGEGFVCRTFQARMAAAWTSTETSIWLVLSGQDLTAKEFIAAWENDPVWRPAHNRHIAGRLDLDCADHTFSVRAQQAQLERWLVDQLKGDRSTFASEPPAETSPDQVGAPARQAQ